MKRLLLIALGVSLSTVTGMSLAGVSHVFVSNTGDQTLSLIRCVTSNGKNPIKCEEKDRQGVGFGTDWPANQYRGHPAWWWSGLSGEVVGIKAKASLSPLRNPRNIVSVDTYDIPGLPDRGSNFIGISPDGRTAWNSAREVDQIQEIDTDPDSPTFGTILHRIDVPDLDMTQQGPGTGPGTAFPPESPNPNLGMARPCDATITPDGRFFLEPDLGGESLTIVDIEAGDILYQVQPPPAIEGEKVYPFMATTNGKIVLVENLEADNTYDIWDVSDLPAPPLYEKKLTQADGLGIDAQTSEFTPDGRYAYLIMRGLPNPIEAGEESRLDVLDVMEGSATYLEIVDNIDLPENCRASTGDFSNDGRYFFVNCQNRNLVAVVDNQTLEVVTTVEVGESPRGVVVR